MIRSSARVRPTAWSSWSSSASPEASWSGDQVEGVPALSVTRRPAQGRRRLTADVDRGRLLHRFGVHGAGGQVVDLAVEGGSLVEPECAQHLEVLVGPAAPALPGHVEHVELLLEPADADTEIDPAAREPVQGADLLGGVHGVALGEEQHGRAEPDRGRPSGQVGQRHHRFQQPAAGRGGDAPVVRVGVPALRTRRRGRRARPPRSSRCRVPQPRWATASSSAAVVMGLAVGIHRSNFTSRLQSSAHEEADFVGGPGGRDRIGLARPHRERAVDLLADEHGRPARGRGRPGSRRWPCRPGRDPRAGGSCRARSS